ncbi:stage II sporulation protein M [Nocardioides bruguierae]|uniref:stage II sporulation protein M n=1 Tax=Nocardioides bruguierae TaxID=2945102 RepID=UPI002021E0BD|nr:stage II sporulation protein M [Nocardioides bruguierae]MCL8024188.1 stage II sporulation protein M [Nocardioides bruguierae]
MDLDAYAEAHAEEWRRLAELVGRRRLDGREADELLDLYQRVATHLSVLRTSAPDPHLVAHLSALLGRARGRAVGTRVGTWAGVATFWTARFPAALWRLRWWWVGTAAANVAVTAVMILWLLAHPSVEQQLLTPAEVDQLVETDFAGYYSEYAASHFAFQVWVNNAWVSALCLALGVLGLPVVYVLFQNVANLAVIGSIMHRHDAAAEFWGLLLPHGLLELTAVFVAGGVGLRLCWAWIDPGPRPRSQALAEAGRTAGTVALGLVGVLAVSGLIEGFVTPSGLPTWARLAIGVLAEVAFVLYVVVPGRAAPARGVTGDLDATLLEDRVAVRG